MNLSEITADRILAAYKTHGYEVDRRNMALNIFGVRAKENMTNRFDDAVGMLIVAPELVFKVFPATTDPGKYWLENPLNVNGTAILKSGQHKNSHRLGLHKGVYRALVQNKALPVWRDSNRDESYDYTADEMGMFGINIHRASESNTSTQVDKWSAGCQVLASPIDFSLLLTAADTHVKNGNGDIFTYTLLNEIDVFLPPLKHLSVTSPQDLVS